nr:pentatricopeptide repeat-containing protein, mitochondrial [Quercus suber]
MKNARIPIIRSSCFSSSRKHNLLVPPNQTFPPTQDSFSHPTATSLSSALQQYINSDNPSYGQKIHSHILKTGFRPNTNISIKLLILHLKCGYIKYARKVFDELPQTTLSAYNYMIGGYLKHGLVEESLSLVRRLVYSGEKPDGFTFSMILKASTCACKVPLLCSLGRLVHAQILKFEVEPDDVLYTALVDSYIKHGKVGYARTVFDMMLEKNVICSTSMISGYMNQGSVKDAEDIFRKTMEKDLVVYNAMIEGYSKSIEYARRSVEVYVDMQRLNFWPNISTFASVIGACSVLAAFEIGQQVQSQLMKTELLTEIKLGSALVDIQFEATPCPNVLVSVLVCNSRIQTANMRAKKAANVTKIAAVGPMKFRSYPKWFSTYHLMVGSGTIPGTLIVAFMSPYCVTISP